MTERLVLNKRLEDCSSFRGTPPGLYDFDRLIESDVDAYGDDGNILFKFRKGCVSEIVNDNFPKLSDLCEETLSLRSDAVGDQITEESRVIGYDLNRRSNGFVAETRFTREQHREYKAIIPIVELVNEIYKKEFPLNYYLQENLEIDPHYLIGRTVFSQSIVNKSFRTHLHKDKGNVEGTVSNMICLGNNSFSGGYLVMPEYRVAINVRPRDYLGFMGRDIWHGNTEIKGSGTRLTIVCYTKRELIKKLYDEEMAKMGMKFLKKIYSKELQK